MNTGENNMSGSEERIEFLELRFLFGNMFIFGIIMLLGSLNWFVVDHHQPLRTLLPKLIENFGFMVMPLLAGVMFFVCLCTMRFMPILFAVMNTALALLLSFLIFASTFWRDFRPG